METESKLVTYPGQRPGHEQAKGVSATSTQRLNVVLCGSDGRLKSSLSKFIRGKKTFHPLLHQKECVRTDVELHGRLLSLVELSALFNTGLSEEEVMHHGHQCVSLCDAGVHAFLLIIPDAPMTDEGKAEIKESLEVQSCIPIRLLYYALKRYECLKEQSERADMRRELTAGTETESVMDVCISIEPELRESEFESESEESEGLPESEFTCHCCYQILLDPTTLTCGHSFCRHCLANWWASALPRVRFDCPECRTLWDGHPQVNILLRDAVEKRFPAEVSRRKQAVLSEPLFCRLLQAFQHYGRRPAPRAAPQQNPPINIREFYSGVVTALTFMTMVVLVWRGLSSDSRHEALLSKPLSRWSTDDVTLWVEHLGVWTNQYQEAFRREKINGRLLFALSDEDLSAAPFSIENPSHRWIFLEELHRLRENRVSLNPWQYKDLFLGKTLFLLIALRNFPRLTLLCLFLFNYEDVFLPFIHTCCPATLDTPTNAPLDWPGWSQWAEFLLMYFLLPYQLLTTFAWHWISDYYWTAGIVIANTMLLTVLDVCFYWSLWKSGELRTIPEIFWLQIFALLYNTSSHVLLWPLMPLFFINLAIYMELYVSPFISAVLVKQALLHIDTPHRP